DLTEKNLGLNPRAIDPNPLTFTQQVSDRDGILKPGATFAYTSTLTNGLQPGAYNRPQQILAASYYTVALPNKISWTGGTDTSFSQYGVLAQTTVTRTLNLLIKNNAS